MAVPRKSLVVSTTMNMVATTNELIVQNARQGQKTQIQLPGMLSRAYMMFYETTLFPVVDYRETALVEE